MSRRGSQWRDKGGGSVHSVVENEEKLAEYKCWREWKDGGTEEKINCGIEIWA